MKEKFIDCIISPEFYLIGDKGTIISKERKVPGRGGHLIRIKERVLKISLTNGYYIVYLINTKNNNIRTSFVLHRLLYCSFFNEDYFGKFHIGHHNDKPTDIALDNLYKTNQRDNLNNKKLAYKLLDLYKKGLIKIPEDYDINTKL